MCQLRIFSLVHRFLPRFRDTCRILDLIQIARLWMIICFLGCFCGRLNSRIFWWNGGDVIVAVQRLYNSCQQSITRLKILIALRCRFVPASLLPIRRCESCRLVSFNIERDCDYYTPSYCLPNIESPAHSTHYISRNPPCIPSIVTQIQSNPLSPAKKPSQSE